jgi:hypothetical protein
MLLHKISRDYEMTGIYVVKQYPGDNQLLKSH